MNKNHRERLLLDRYRATRARTLKLAQNLSDGDQTVQSMPDASPTKWHLAHTTWFFEAVILDKIVPNYRRFNEKFFFLFNSYYEQAGPRNLRTNRGMITRPSKDEIESYRKAVDKAMEDLMTIGSVKEDVLDLIEIGCNHEEQHQELLLTDILHLFSLNPLKPVALEEKLEADDNPVKLEWIDFKGGIVEIGHDPSNGFSYDNEMPRHKSLLAPFQIANRLVTNEEWIHFIEDKGYETPLLWLSDGWATVNNSSWKAPEYWEKRDGIWWTMTLHGMQPLKKNAPVTHVSYFEADAFARWSNKRLPLEIEWEHAVGSLNQAFGALWQWTSSAYLGYPGFRTFPGKISEYNGKFMNGQYVLRGSSIATPSGHSRKTYRNFFYPHQRWQFTGLRLAGDLN